MHSATTTAVAKHRMRRWFQFGILDLLIATAVLAVVAVLCRPVHARSNKALPWVIGDWQGDSLEVGLLPDGCYVFGEGKEVEWGYRWTLAPVDDGSDGFLLTCGKRRWRIRSEWGSGVMEVLNEDGGVRSRLEQVVQMDGAWSEGAPHGMWRFVYRRARRLIGLLMYQHGDPVGIRFEDFLHEKTMRTILEQTRKLRGLPELADRQFDNAGTTEESPK